MANLRFAGVRAPSDAEPPAVNGGNSRAPERGPLGARDAGPWPQHGTACAPRHLAEPLAPAPLPPLLFLFFLLLGPPAAPCPQARQVLKPYGPPQPLQTCG